MASRRAVLKTLRLSRPLLALVNGELAHPAVAQVCRPVRPELLQPQEDDPDNLVPLWEDASGSDIFFEAVYARRLPGGLEFWSLIFDFDEGPEPVRVLLASAEQGVLFWLFYCFFMRQEQRSADWDLGSLAVTLGFRYLDRLVAFRRASAARGTYDDLDRLRELLLAIPDDSDAGISGELERFIDEGEAFIDGKQFPDALARFQAAWDVLPQPKTEQEPAVRLMAAIADCHFHLQNWEACHEAMQHALRCGASVADPFLRLRLGQSMYELGNEREAANWLVPVYLTEGRAPFAYDDPKYLEFFRDKLRPPEGGWPQGW
jgi:hypothetical protein